MEKIKRLKQVDLYVLHFLFLKYIYSQSLYTFHVQWQT